MLSFAFKKIYFSFIFHPASFPYKKNYHTLISYAFIHFNVNHLCINLLGLFIFGLEVEEYLQTLHISNWLLPLLFIVGVLCASLVALVKKKSVMEFSLVGASHGVFCLIGNSLLLQPLKVINFIPIPIPNVYLIIGFIILFLIKTYDSKSKIDYLGHAVGFFTGILSGIIIKIAGVQAI
jgi:membrane associated rhomboid family serine protease